MPSRGRGPGDLDEFDERQGMEVKRWKTWQISLFVLVCILLNLAGRDFTARFHLPLWLDSFGTVLAAYTGGPLVGAIVGITDNLLYGMVREFLFVYSLTSFIIALIVGIASEKGWMENFFGMMTVSSITAILSTAISVILNIFYFGGETGNLWGNGVLHYLGEHGFPPFICLIAGEFYLEFLDKVFTIALLYLLILAKKAAAKRLLAGKTAEQGKDGPPSGGGAALLGIFLLACLAGSSLRGVEADSPTDVIDYGDYVQTIYNSRNGLPCGEANDIVETSDGILWIGTYAGLYRYNGSEFRWMDGYDSVKNVNCLYVDEEGRLWIGTNDNGLSICINEKIVNVIDQSSGLPSNSVRSIIRSSDGYYYIGTTGSMQVLTLNSGLKSEGTLPEINYADAICADEAGHVVTVTSDGRVFLVKGGELQNSLSMEGSEEIFTSCGFDLKGRLLLGSSADRVRCYDISSGRFILKDSFICEGLQSLNDFYFLENGEIFIAADNGIGYLDAGGSFHLINVNEFNNSIDNIVVDYQGNFWFASSRLGLLRLSSSSFKDIYTTAGMESRVVNTVMRWRGNYYFGTDSGLDIVDESCRTRIENELTREMDGMRIRCLLADSSGNLWICTYGKGLIEVAPDGTEYYYNSENGSFGNRARLATELRDGTIAAAGDTGMSFIRGHRIERTIGYADGLINSMILTVTELPDGRILAGTDGDGLAVIENGEVTRMLTRNEGLSSEVILRTVKDGEGGAVFIVTSNGLCYMDEHGSIRILENFPYYNNYDVWIKDGETLFVMSSAGIYVVDREEVLSGGENVNYELLDSRKGLGSALTANSWNYVDENENLFLSCDKGVFVIDTDRYAFDTRSYRMNITSVNLDGVDRRVEPGEAIRVGRGVSRVEIRPEVINYTIQDPYVGYYLEGYEQGWIILPQSSVETIAYTNLPTGKYTFRLAVFDSNQERILEERRYELIKEKEIYDNHYFRGYLLAVAFLAVAWFTFCIVGNREQRKLVMQQRELELAQQKIQMGNETIVAIAKAVDAKDERTSRHSQRVSEYSVMIGRELGFDEDECENLRRAALTHDIGKIGIPDSILNKPARLTDEEYGIMKSHTVRGAEILKDFTLIDHVVEGAQYHHERYDGKGYPAGLKGEEIPLYGRIIGVADAFDAMTANRVYRKQMDLDYVLSEMRKGRGTQFDPQMVDILLRLIDEGKIDLNSLYPGMQDASGEKKAPEEKEISGEKKASEEKEISGEKKASEEKEISGEKKASEEKETTGEKKAPEQKGASEEKEASGNKEGGAS